MNSKKTEATEGKKSGDGLSKKERRALKVVEKGGPKQVTTESEIAKTIEHPKVKQNDKNQLKQKVVNPVIKPENSNKLVKSVDKNSKRIPSENVLIKAPTGSDTTPVSDKVEASNGPSKAQLKAERRALQEKQRLAKLTPTPTTTPNSAPPQSTATPQQQTKKPLSKPSPTPKPPLHHTTTKTTTGNVHQVPLFNHLYQPRTADHCKTGSPQDGGLLLVPNVHPAFVRLGRQYAAKSIVGSNARCLALLAALKELVGEFVTPPKQELCRSMETAVQMCVDHLQNNSRKLSVSMTNALRHFKVRLTQIDTSLEDSQKKTELLKIIDIYMGDDIDKAGEAISISVRQKINDGDVILTYGCSSLIKRILLDARKSNLNFSVIVLDARPLLEGREMLRCLVEANITCTYMLMNAACYVMGSATKVILGAHALLANGSVMARTGSAQVAMVAQRYNKPVLVCCETYKFCERAQTDSYVYNELGDPDALAQLDTVEEPSPLTNWKNIDFLTPLNLMYDVTPPDYVTVVVTELGSLPCTSVPVILRVKLTEIA